MRGLKSQDKLPEDINVTIGCPCEDQNQDEQQSAQNDEQQSAQNDEHITSEEIQTNSEV